MSTGLRCELLEGQHAALDLTRAARSEFGRIVEVETVAPLRIKGVELAAITGAAPGPVVLDGFTFEPAYFPIPLKANGELDTGRRMRKLRELTRSTRSAAC